MLKRFLLALAFALVPLGAAAQIAVPNTLTAGTTIQAAPLNTNFSTIANHALDRLAGGNISGNVTMDGGITIDGIDLSTALCSTCAATFLTVATTDVTATALKATGDVTTKFHFPAVSAAAVNIAGFERLRVDVNGLTVYGTNILNNTGKIPAISATYFTSLSGANLTAVPTASLTGTVGTANLGTGVAASTSFLRGDGTWAKALVVSEFDNGNSGVAVTIDFATNGPIQKVTRTGNATYTLTAPASPGTVVIRFIHNATATVFTVTFSPTVKFPNGTTPTWTNSSGAVDLLSLYWDGTAWYGVQTPNLS